MHSKILIILSKNIGIIAACLFVLLSIGSKEGYAQRNISSKDTTNIIELINKGRQYRKHSKDTTLHLLYSALNKSKAMSYTDGIGIALFNIGLTYTIYNQTDSAIVYHLRAIPYCKESIHYRDLVPALYSNIGYSFYQRAEYQIAVAYYDSSIQEGLKLNLPAERKHLAITLNNLGAIHIKLNQLDKALQLLDQAEEICRKGGFPVELAISLQNKASIYAKRNDDKKAEHYYSESIRLSSEYDNNIEATANLLSGKAGLAELKLKQKRPEEALQLLDEVESMNKDFYKEYASITPNYLKGYAYLQLKDYARAEHYLLKSLKELSEINITDNLLDIHKTLSQMYDSAGKYKKALEHFYTYEQLKDSLLSQEKIRDINEIDAKYRSAEKDKMLAIAQKKAAEKNMLIWITAGGIVVLLSLVIIFYRQSKQKQKIYGQQEEINTLKAMMQGEEKERTRIAGELHDGIGGMLATLKMNISNLGSEADSLKDSKTFKATLALVEETAQEVRRTSHNLIPAVLEIHSLEEALALYCDNIKRTTDIAVSLQVHGSVEGLPKQVELLLYRMVQELIQNVVKHAQATLAYVQVSGYENSISIAVEDNGTGIDSDHNNNGIGLHNLQYKVAALGGNMNIDSVKDRNTIVVVEFDREKLKLVV